MRTWQIEFEMQARRNAVQCIRCQAEELQSGLSLREMEHRLPAWVSCYAYSVVGTMETTLKELETEPLDYEKRSKSSAVLLMTNMHGRMEYMNEHEGVVRPQTVALEDQLLPFWVASLPARSSVKYISHVRRAAYDSGLCSNVSDVLPSLQCGAKSLADFSSLRFEDLTQGDSYNTLERMFLIIQTVHDTDLDVES